MKKETKQYTPAEFIEKLKGETDHPKPLVFVGMLKAAEDDQHLMFANGASCTHWTPVPVERIEGIEWISDVPCKDHSHPLVKMTLKTPASEEAMMYASLAQSTSLINSASQSMGSAQLAVLERIRHLRDGERAVLFQNSGPDVWFPCWSHCMDDILDIAIQQPPEHWKFWTSLAYQLCGQICP